MVVTGAFRHVAAAVTASRVTMPANRSVETGRRDLGAGRRVREFVDNRRAKRLQVARRAAGDDIAVDDDFLVDNDGAGVAQIGSDALIRRQRASGRHTGFDQRPRAVADRGDRLSRVDEVAHERDSLAVHAQLVRIHCAARQHQSVEPVDRAVSDVSVDEFDALVLPGGTVNPDKLRMDSKAVAFVRDFVNSGKPVAAICHGPWTLVEAGVAAGRTLTSYQSIRTDLRNAGAIVVDEEVVVDGNVITSRSPRDLEAFCSTIVDKFAHAPTSA